MQNKATTVGALLLVVLLAIGVGAFFLWPDTGEELPPPAATPGPVKTIGASHASGGGGVASGGLRRSKVPPGSPAGASGPPMTGSMGGLSGAGSGSDGGWFNAQ